MASGFGASDGALKTSNYQVVFTPRKEYQFVTDAAFQDEMDAGIDYETQDRIGVREKVDLEVALADAANRITDSFKKMGWSSDGAKIAEDFKGLKFTIVELAALRLYTGPMFLLYNTKLRSMSSGGTVPERDSQLGGLRTHGRYTTTIHAINSGIIKLSRIQPTCTIYRGMSGMKLPSSFLEPNAYNVRAGVEVSLASVKFLPSHR